MRKKYFKQSVFSFILFGMVCLTFLCFSGCSLASDSTTGTLKINFPTTVAKSIFTPAVSLHITSYKLNLSNGDNTQEFKFASTESLLIDSLIPGEWSLTVQGYNGLWTGDKNSGVVVAYLEKNVNGEHKVSTSINRGTVTEVNLNMVPISEGTGSLELTVDWSAVSSKVMLNDPTIDIQVEGYNSNTSNYEDNSGIYSPSDIVGSTYTYSNLSPGWYEITTTLSPSSDSDGESSPMYISIDFARIVPDKTTVGSIELTDTMLSTGSVTWELSEDLDPALRSFTVSYTGQDSIKYTNIDQEFTCSYESNAATYQWYVDGQVVDAAISKDFTYQFSTNGSHVVSVAVEDGGVVNGASLPIAIQPGYTVGNHGPAGGWIFYCDERDAYTGWTYMEAAPDDLSNMAWSTITDTLIGTTSTLLGHGDSNTQAIIAQNNGAASAALACTEYSVDIDGDGIADYSDWFLPTMSSVQVLRDLGILPSYHWSSSEESSSFAYLHRGLRNFKSQSYPVRPIRKF